MRLRFISSRGAGYRRGGLTIGDAAAPTIVTRGELEPATIVALLEDRNVAVAFSHSDDGDDFAKLSDEERAEGIAAARAELSRVDPASPPTADAALASAESAHAAAAGQLLKDRAQLDEDRKAYVLGKEQLEKDRLAIEAARAQLAEDQQALDSASAAFDAEVAAFDAGKGGGSAETGDATAKADEGAAGAANNAPADAVPPAEAKAQSTAAKKPASIPGKPKGSKD